MTKKGSNIVILRSEATKNLKGKSEKYARRESTEILRLLRSLRMTKKGSKTVILRSEATKNLKGK